MKIIQVETAEGAWLSNLAQGYYGSSPAILQSINERTLLFRDVQCQSDEYVGLQYGQSSILSLFHESAPFNQKPFKESQPKGRFGSRSGAISFAEHPADLHFGNWYEWSYRLQ